jgi:phospholipid/cholesterol/gamma-HCH transport system substrate-binding protein
MNDSRFAIKVGLFVSIGTVLLALLILNFSKGNTLGKSTYKLYVILPNAAGLKPAADVMMAGVPIGRVTEMDLTNNATAVKITASILDKYKNKIRKDATFRIDALGFLGDQYIEVSAPTDTNETAYFQEGDEVMGESTFNMTEAVKSISSVVDQAKKTMKDLDQAITNVNKSALSTNTLTHFVQAVSNLDLVSQRAVVASQGVEDLLNSNTVPFNSTIMNFQALSVRLTNTAADLDHILLTNKDDVRKMVSKLALASDQIAEIVSNLQAGQGAVGHLLKDEKMSAEMASMVSNADSIAANVSLFTSNLNQRGIWAMLWKPKHVDTNRPPVRPMRP